MRRPRLAWTVLTAAVLAGCGGGRSKTRDAGQPDVLLPADVPAHLDLAAELATSADLVTGAEAADAAEPPVDGAASEAAAEPARDGSRREGVAGEAMPDVTDLAATEAGVDGRLPADLAVADQGAAGDTDPETEELRALCLATGGTVVTIPCCVLTKPFPTTCPYLNACGCAEEYLVPKEICECPGDTCFELSSRVGCR